MSQDNFKYDFEAAAESLRAYKEANQDRVNELKRCFIIGNGPSLTPEDLEQIKALGEFSIASNRIYLIFDKTDWRPDVYTSLDLEIIKASVPEIIDLQAALKLICVESPANIPEQLWAGDILPVKKIMNYNNWLVTGKLPPFSDDITKGIYHGMTVTYFNIQTAVWLGFKEIILIGIDHQFKNHFHVSSPERASVQCIGIPGRINQVQGVERNHFADNYVADLPGGSDGEAGRFYWIDAATMAYIAAKKYAEAHGIRIINATRGGKLDIFERVNFDRLIKSKTDDKQYNKALNISNAKKLKNALSRRKGK